MIALATQQANRKSRALALLDDDVVLVAGIEDLGVAAGDGAIDVDRGEIDDEPGRR